MVKGFQFLQHTPVRDLNYVGFFESKALLLTEMKGDNISGKGTNIPMDDIKVPFPEEGKNGKDDGAGYQKGNVR
ncbi:unnamed protein product [marine sediment metagenome]|uniref:Uncharacterized protein n=1 Tax=marine sediment metagenome TaxID=412755 RepID=X1MYF6_9ZZZZ